MPEWTVGAIFGVCIMIVFLPVQVIFTYKFWERRNIQPIKARMPGLVVLTDCVTFLWIMQLGLQRIAADSYPCLLNLWTGFIGTIVLFNTYVWRCWVLYFTFELTQERLLGTKKSESRFIKNRKVISNTWGIKCMGTLTCIALLPCGILTATNQDIPNLAGDDCERYWGDNVLAAYMFCYVAFFLGFTFKLRQVVEGFRIKEELFVTALIAPFVFIPWFLFNSSFEDVNNDIFPFSTLCLVLGVVAQFTVSTIWPLWQSLTPPSMDAIVVAPADVNTLAGVLSTKKGVMTFKSFLTKEFSVENVLFYEEIEQYRGKKASGEESEEVLVMEAQRIYAKYIIPDAPFQVNLPQNIVKDLDGSVRNILAPNPELYNMQPGEAEVNEIGYVAPATPTIFDASQKEIFKLMNTDSFPRYQRSEYFREFVEEVEKTAAQTKIFEEEGIVALTSPSAKE